MLLILLQAACSPKKDNGIISSRVMVQPLPESTLPTSYPFMPLQKIRLITGQEGRLLVTTPHGERMVVNPSTTILTDDKNRGMRLEHGSITAYVNGHGYTITSAKGDFWGTGIFSLAFDTKEIPKVKALAGTGSLRTISSIHKISSSGLRSALPVIAGIPGIVLTDSGTMLLPESIHVTSSVRPLSSILNVSASYNTEVPGKLLISVPWASVSTVLMPLEVTLSGGGYSKTPIPLKRISSTTAYIRLPAGRHVIDMRVPVKLPYIHGGYVLDLPLTPCADVSGTLDISRMGNSPPVSPSGRYLSMKTDTTGLRYMNFKELGTISILFPRKNPVGVSSDGVRWEPVQPRKQAIVIIGQGDPIPQSVLDGFLDLLTRVFSNDTTFMTMDGKRIKKHQAASFLSGRYPRPQSISAALKILPSPYKSDRTVIVYIGPPEVMGIKDWAEAFNWCSSHRIPLLLLFTGPWHYPIEIPYGVTVLTPSEIKPPAIDFLLKKLSVSGGRSPSEGTVTGDKAFSTPRPGSSVIYEPAERALIPVMWPSYGKKPLLDAPSAQNLSQTTKNTSSTLEDELEGMVRRWHMPNTPAAFGVRLVSSLLRAGKRTQAKDEAMLLRTRTTSYKYLIKAGLLLYEYGFKHAGSHLFLWPYMKHPTDVKAILYCASALEKTGHTEQARLLMEHALSLPGHDKDAYQALAMLLWKHGKKVPDRLLSALPRHLRAIINPASYHGSQDLVAVIHDTWFDRPSVSLNMQAQQVTYPHAHVVIFYGRLDTQFKIHLRWAPDDSAAKQVVIVRPTSSRTRHNSIKISPANRIQAVISVKDIALSVE